MNGTRAICPLHAIAAVLLVWAAVASAEAIDVPICNAPRLNGNLDDACWSNAVRLETFYDVRTGKPVEEPGTAVWLCRDDAWLYIAFRCEEPPGTEIRAHTLRHGGEVVKDDSVEIFVDPGTDGETYLHFMLNAANVQREQLVFRESKLYYDWLSGWRSATAIKSQKEGGGWSAEVMIPLSLLWKRRGEQEWRINLCRNRWATTPAMYLSLAPLPKGSGYHSPRAFLPLGGMPESTPQLTFRPEVAEIKVGALTPEGDHFVYTVNVELCNHGGKSGDVELVVRDRLQGVPPTAFMERVHIPPMQGQSAAVRVVTKQPGKREISVGFRLAGSEHFLRMEPVDRRSLSGLAPFDAYWDRDYYTTEKQAVIHVSFALSPETLAQQQLSIECRILDPDGQSVQTQRIEKVNARDCSLRFDLRKVPTGKSSVEVRVTNAAGISLGFVSTELCKRPPAPEPVTEVKVDRYNRCLLLNGKPFFPIGTWFCSFAFQRPPEARENPEEINEQNLKKRLQYALDVGCNMVIDWNYFTGGTSVETGKRLLDEYWKYGLYVITRPYSYGEPIYVRYALPDAKERAFRVMRGGQMEEYIRMAARHPATISYYTWDEPPSEYTDLLREFYDRVHAIDDYHPVFLAASRGCDKPEWYGTTADVIEAHRYWRPYEPESLYEIPACVAAHDAFSRQAHAPTLFGCNLECRGPMTTSERRAMVYLALVHGARSMIYFAAPCTFRLTYEQVRDISQELHKLAPVLLTRSPAQTSTFSPESAVVQGFGRTLPAVQTLLKNNPDGGQLLLAVNSTRYPVEVRYQISSLGRDSRVTRMFQHAKYTVKDGAFSDRLEPLGTRAYRLTHTRPVKPPIRLQVHMTGQAVQADRVSPPDLGPNLISNPGFESEQGWAGQNEKCRRTREDPHSGQWCMSGHKDPQTSVVVCSEPVTLKPATRYRFGGWIRSNLTQGREGSRFLLWDGHREGSGRQRIALATPRAPLKTEDWTCLQQEIDTPSGEPVTVRLYAGRMPGGTAGDIVMDDLFLCEVGPARGLRKNLIQNPSFEREQVAGTCSPEHWAVAGWDRMIPHPNACMRTDEAAWHGRHAFRYAAPPGTTGMAKTHTPWIRIKPATDYTLSFYMKTETPGTRYLVVVDGSTIKRMEHIATLDKVGWTRCTYTFRSPQELPEGRLEHSILFKIYAEVGKGTVYLDAVQLEEGRKATAFQDPGE